MTTLDKQIETVERIIEKQKALDIATDKYIEKLKNDIRELKAKSKLYKKQLHKFGVIFDNYNKQKKGKRHG